MVLVWMILCGLATAKGLEGINKIKRIEAKTTDNNILFLS